MQKTNTTDQELYGYGHTAEAAKVVRQALAEGLSWHRKQYRLKIRVLRASSGYGGPRVEITTDHPAFMHYYEYLVDADGTIGNAGRLVQVPTYKTARPHYTARLVKAADRSADAKATENAIREILGRYGKDEDDAMTDYFNNTTPLYYGIEYKEAAK